MLPVRQHIDAARLRPALRPYAGLHLLAEPFVALFGSADRYLGAVDSLLGQGDPEASLVDAVELDTRMAAPVHIAQTLAVAALHHRRAGAEARARHSREDGREQLDPGGPVRRRARPAGVTGAGVTPRRGRRPPGPSR